MHTRHLGTVRLPPPRPIKGRRGKRVSALICTLITFPLQAEHSATQQIEQAATTYLERMIAEEAERNGWQDLSYNLNITPLTDGSALALCSAPLKITQTSGQPTALERLRLELSCSDPPGWTQAVSTRQDLFLPVLTTATPIDRGQLIEPAHLKRERVNISRAQRGFMVHESEVVGLSARRRLRADLALTPAMLSEAAPVRRGQPVRIIARQQGIQAATQGEALADGAIGDIIRARNTTSDAVIRVKVTGPGEVTSTWE